mgnify:CR=1 FL=1
MGMEESIMEAVERRSVIVPSQAAFQPLQFDYESSSWFSSSNDSTGRLSTVAEGEEPEEDIIVSIINAWLNSKVDDTRR